MLKQHLGIDDQGSPVVVVQTPTAPDRPTLGGANQPAYGYTNSISVVEMVPTPTTNTYRVIYMVTLHNPNTDAAPIVFFQVNNNTISYIVHAVPALATKASADWEPQGGLVLLAGQSLEVVCVSAPSTELHWSAHWADPSV